MPNPCPACQTELTKTTAGQYSCPACQTQWRLKPLCPDCGHELEVLKACGAVDFFCNHCNSLQSRSTIRREFVLLSQQ